MHKPILHIRNFSTGDFNSYFELRNQIERYEGWGRYFSRRALLEHLDRPNYSPHQNLLIAESEGRLVGFCDLYLERQLGRVLVESMVLPARRRQGVATSLFEHARVKALKIGGRVIQTGVSEKNVPARQLLGKLGFRPVNRFFEMQFDLSRVYSPPSRSFFTLRHMRKGEEEKLTNLQNRAFTGSWGFNPNTVEEIIHTITTAGASHRDVIFVIANDEPVGYCWTAINESENKITQKNKGRIHMMGVDSQYRGQGAGRAALMAGLAHFRNRGLDFAVLTVEAGNEPALSLYRSTGFEVISVTEWYEHGLSSTDTPG